MSTRYFVNDNPQPTGEREVHADGCSWLARAVSVTPLGYCDSCREAVAKARKIYNNVDGCMHCIPACHTR